MSKHLHTDIYDNESCYLTCEIKGSMVMVMNDVLHSFPQHSLADLSSSSH